MFKAVRWGTQRTEKFVYTIKRVNFLDASIIFYSLSLLLFSISFYCLLFILMFYSSWVTLVSELRGTDCMGVFWGQIQIISWCPPPENGEIGAPSHSDVIGLVNEDFGCGWCHEITGWCSRLAYSEQKNHKCWGHVVLHACRGLNLGLLGEKS